MKRKLNKKIIMKKLFVLVVLTVFLSMGCSKPENKTLSENKDVNTEQSVKDDKGEVIEIKVPTVQCGTCKMNLTKAFKKAEGINSFEISIDNKLVKVDYDKTKTNPEKIEGVIVMAGYQANDKPANEEAYEKLADCCKVGGHDK